MTSGPEIDDDQMPEIRQISQNFTKFYLLFKYDVSKLGGILDCADSVEGIIMENILT